MKEIEHSGVAGTEQVFFESIVKESKRSILFKIEEGKNVWVSRDLISDYSSEKKTFFIPLWLYQEHFI